MLSPAGAKQTDQSRAPRGERDHHSVAAIDLVGFTAIFAVVIRLRGRRCRALAAACVAAVVEADRVG